MWARVSVMNLGRACRPEMASAAGISEPVATMVERWIMAALLRAFGLHSHPRKLQMKTGKGGLVRKWAGCVEPGTGSYRRVRTIGSL